jgi:hypothetical protein
MTCEEARELIEPIAVGDTESDAFRLHAAACHACSAALAQALRIERALAALPQEVAPPRFAQAVRARIGRERWRYEQRIDRAFNVAVAGGVVMVAAAVLSLLNIGSAAQMLLAAIEAVADASRPSAATQGGSLLTAGLTAGLLAIVIAISWWAERRTGYQ